jgi:hypothetical protein
MFPVPVCAFNLHVIPSVSEGGDDDAGDEASDSGAPKVQKCLDSAQRALFLCACGPEVRVVCLSTGAALAAARVDDEQVTSVCSQAVTGSVMGWWRWMAAVFD